MIRLQHHAYSFWIDIVWVRVMVIWFHLNDLGDGVLGVGLIYTGRVTSSGGYVV